MLRTITLAILCAAAMIAPAEAADAPVGKHHMRAHHSHTTRAFPLSRRARDIRLADACWRDCQVEAKRVYQRCLRTFPPAVCNPSNDAADRFCQRECRVSGGPWVDWAD